MVARLLRVCLQGHSTMQPVTRVASGVHLPRGYCAAAHIRPLSFQSRCRWPCTPSPHPLQTVMLSIAADPGMPDSSERVIPQVGAGGGTAVMLWDSSQAWLHW